MARVQPDGNNPAAPSQQSSVLAGQDPAEITELLRLASSGDQEAWRHLVGLYWRRVFALARSRLKDQSLAEEVTQSVFVTIATKLGQGQYAERGRFEPWLFRVAVNRVRDQLRAANRGAVNVDDAVFDAQPAAEQTADSDERTGLIGALRRALEGLNDADRQIVELRHHAGMSFAQMADLLGEPLGTLLARHHRALKKLKDTLAGAHATSEEKR